MCHSPSEDSQSLLKNKWADEETPTVMLATNGVQAGCSWKRPGPLILSMVRGGILVGLPGSREPGLVEGRSVVQGVRAGD